MDDLTREFLLESQEGLDRMERCLTELETRPGDVSLLAEIFRSVHTIKGTTGFLGFGRLEALSHAGENLLGLLRDGQLSATPDLVTGLLALMDMLRGILRSIEATGDEGESRREDHAMIARLENLEKADSVVADADPAPLVMSAFAPETAAKQACYENHQLQHQRSSPEPESSGQAGLCGDSDAIPAPGEALAGSLSTILTSSPVSAPPVTMPPGAAAGAVGLAAADSTLRVEIELLNRIMNLVGELVLTRNQVLQATSADASLAGLRRRLDMVTADLREAVMKARMQPVSHLFSRFPRLVRDLASSLGKRVRLELQGQQTELDKSLLEAIRDPLTHAIRNAIDHGIEIPEERRAHGKPAEGSVRLRALHEGSHVIVEVQDDGAGFDITRIREKAIERHLIPAPRAEQMSDREILQLVFLPGFSTASAVTSVSGRGVGMDVVRTNVEKIGGKVEIDSRAGEGTVLRLRIPLTLAIVPALIVRSRGQNFALPQASLTELVHLSAAESSEQIEHIENAALYRLRGRLLPLIFLDRLLEQPAREPATGCDVAVLNADGRRYGLVVDALGDPEEIVVKPLAAVLRDIGVYAGATILGNGQMALILNPGAIAQRAGIGLAAETEETQNAQAAASRQYLLVERGNGRAALPLETVVRIERIPRRRIERAGSRPVLRFGDRLLPLDDAAGGTANPESQTTVVICRDRDREVGIAVSQVLDVAAGQRLEEAGSGVPASDFTLLDEQVTGIVHLSALSPLDGAAPALHLTEVQQ